MRGLAPLCSALLGVALILPAPARAGEPDVDPTGDGQPVRGEGSLQCRHNRNHATCRKCRADAKAAHRGRAPHLCAKCMARAYPNTVVNAPTFAGGPVVSGAPCIACQPGLATGPPVVVAGGESPGYAALGGAPGAVVLSSAVMSTEPAPVGVMQTSFAPAPAGAPGYASVGSPAGGATAAIPPAQEAVAPSRHQRPRILAHLFGLDAFGRHREERQAEVAARHAAISYGANDRPVTELPASVVYGK